MLTHCLKPIQHYVLDYNEKPIKPIQTQSSNKINIFDFHRKKIPVSDGVLPNCQVKCDTEPCKNGGICTENFAKQESYCNCEHTSFMGEFCMEEKGADFSGGMLTEMAILFSN